MLKDFVSPVGRNVKTYQRANHFGVKKNPILGKIFTKFYAVLPTKCAFWCNFFEHFGILCYFLAFIGTIWVFWAFHTVLSQIRFVVNYALFQVKYFWLKPFLSQKIPLTGDTKSLDR